MEFPKFPCNFKRIAAALPSKILGGGGISQNMSGPVLCLIARTTRLLTTVTDDRRDVTRLRDHCRK